MVEPLVEQFYRGYLEPETKNPQTKLRKKNWVKFVVARDRAVLSDQPLENVYSFAVYQEVREREKKNGNFYGSEKTVSHYSTQLGAPRSFIEIVINWKVLLEAHPS